MRKYVLERRDEEDGHCYYEVMLIDHDIYRALCVIDEDDEQPGQALIDGRLIVAALEEYKVRRVTLTGDRDPTDRSVRDETL